MAPPQDSTKKSNKAFIEEAMDIPEAQATAEQPDIDLEDKDQVNNVLQSVNHDPQTAGIRARREEKIDELLARLTAEGEAEQKALEEAAEDGESETKSEDEAEESEYEPDENGDWVQNSNGKWVKWDEIQDNKSATDEGANGTGEETMD